jgi:hypothetical protein
LAQPLHLIQANIKVNNFAQATLYKLLLDSEIASSKVGTRDQSEDHMHFGFLHFNTNLTTNTTIPLQILFKSNPPNFTQKFQNSFLAAISTNTLCAIICQLNTYQKPTVHSLNPHA